MPPAPSGPSRVPGANAILAAIIPSVDFVCYLQPSAGRITGKTEVEIRGHLIVTTSYDRMAWDIKAQLSRVSPSSLAPKWQASFIHDPCRPVALSSPHGFPLST